MSSRTVLRPHPVIVNGDMSATSITSEVTLLQSLSKPSYEFSWTGSTPVGTITVQVSNSYSAQGSTVLNAGNWTTIPVQMADGSIVTSIPVTGNTGSGIIDLITAVYAIRVVYTKTSGTGTLQAIISGKIS